MAKSKEISYERAMEGISSTKLWPAGFKVSWVTSCKKVFPKGWEFRIPLALEDGVVQTGLFLKAYFKEEARPELRDKLSLTLFVDSCRVVGIDENGLGTHTNKIGKGLRFYGERIGYPHLHFPARDGGADYAEPIEIATYQQYWELFLEKSNIVGAPAFHLPTNAQIELL